MDEICRGLTVKPEDTLVVLGHRVACAIDRSKMQFITSRLPPDVLCIPPLRFAADLR